MRPLRKRWRYVGVFLPEIALCAGDAQAGPLRQRFWAVALPDGRIAQRTGLRNVGVELTPGRLRIRAPEAEVSLDLDEVPGVECVSPAGKSTIWTSKQAGVAVRGSIKALGTLTDIDEPAGFIDDSAGHHPHRMDWRWSAGVGVLGDGRPAAWNLVTGIHDAPDNSERTLWVAGEPQSTGPVEFAEDLSHVRGSGFDLTFDEWAAREDETGFGPLRSEYRQPFGWFAGPLPGGLHLARGTGVMEAHRVRW